MKLKAATLSWELMFTRSMYQTPDMIEQHRWLNRVARLGISIATATVVAFVLLIGVELFSAVVFDNSMLPYPIWFKIGCVNVIPVAALVGCRFLTRGKESGGSELEFQTLID